jgi:hypothetical protein
MSNAHKFAVWKDDRFIAMCDTELAALRHAHKASIADIEHRRINPLTPAAARYTVRPVSDSDQRLIAAQIAGVAS